MKSKTDKTASASQNRAMAKDAAITGLPTLDPNDMPTPAQRRKWAKEYRDAQDGALKLIPAAKPATACQKTPKERLEHIRGELRAERISYDELHELQSLAEFIEPGDVELLEAAGVPEFPESQHEESGCTNYLQHTWESCPENKAKASQKLPTTQERIDSLLPDPRETARSIHTQAARVAQALVDAAREALANWEGARK